MKVFAQFNPCFREANRTKKRYRVFYGSAGSGKSVNIAQDYIAKLSDKRYQGANLLVVRGVDETNQYSTYAELTAAINRLFGRFAEKHWRVNKSPLRLQSLDTGAEIIFRGMADDRQREKVKSVTFAKGKLTWIWCEEATELRKEDVEILDDRLRGELPNKNLYYQITLSFNPVSASHWIKARFFDIQSDSVYISHSTYLDNRFIDSAYHERMKLRAMIDPEGYKVYGLGEWGELGGLILTRYKVMDFDTSPERFDSMAIGQDFGFNHANAILLLGMKDGDVYVCSEIYVHQKDKDEIIAIADKIGLPRHLWMWCDSAEPASIKTWRRNGYRAQAVEKEVDSVNAQISWLKRRTIYIHPSCVNTYKEIQAWKYMLNKKTGEYEDEPVAIFDDAMAALRYGIEGWRPKLKYDKRKGGADN